MNKSNLIIIFSILFLSSFLFSQEKESELRFGLMTQDISTVYPWEIIDLATGALLSNVYEQLTQFSENSTSIQPALAEKWDYSPDFKTWTFYLRKNVKFHNGEIFNADSVIETFKYVRIIKPKIEKINDYEIKMILNEPNSALLITLATDYCSIVSKATIESYLKKKDPPDVYGTGPFIFNTWIKGKKIVLTKNKNYWGKQALIDKITFYPFKTNEALMKALMENKIDLTDGIIPDNIPAIRSNPKLYFKAQTGLNFAYLAFNLTRKPFNDKRVREAIAHSIDKKNLINKFFYNGQGGVAAKSCLPPSMFGYYKDIPEYEYNPDKAKKLLQEAGYPEGFDTTLTPTGAVRPYMPDPIGIANAVKDQLAAIGVRAKIVHTNSWKEFLEITTAKSNFDLALMGWIADTGDPNDFLTSLLATQSIGLYNSSQWSNKEFDSLLIQARAQSPEKRIELYRKAQLLVYKEIPIIPLFHSFQLAAWNEKVHNFKLHPASRLFLKSVYMK